jgi:hypothetical protein
MYSSRRAARTHSKWRMRLRQRSSQTSPSHWHSGPGSLGGILQRYLRALFGGWGLGWQGVDGSGKVMRTMCERTRGRGLVSMSRKGEEESGYMIMYTYIDRGFMTQPTTTTTTTKEGDARDVAVGLGLAVDLGEGAAGQAEGRGLPAAG